MRAKVPVGTDENKSDNNADPLAEQPQQEKAVNEQPQREEAQPEAQRTPSTPAAEEASSVGRLPCVHMIEAFFAAVTAAVDLTTSVAAPAATEGERLVEPPPPPVESSVRPAEQEVGQGVPQVESRPVAAFVAFALGSLLFYQQDRAARKAAAEEERRTTCVPVVR